MAALLYRLPRARHWIVVDLIAIPDSAVLHRLDDNGVALSMRGELGTGSVDPSLTPSAPVAWSCFDRLRRPLNRAEGLGVVYALALLEEAPAG